MDVVTIKRPDRDRLGEGPVWDAHRDELLWVDIVGHRVNRLNLASGAITHVTLNEPIGWIIPRARHENYIAGLASGIVMLDVATGGTFPIYNPEPDRPSNRMNDAKVDRWGRIWAGTKSDLDEAGAGALYRLDTDMSCHRMDDGYGVTNGPTFSLDGTTMFHTDSAARTVYAFDFEEDGTLGARRIWLRFEEEWGYPDGMTTDAEGCLWIAHWDGARISRFSPDGERIHSIPLPAKNITSCTFAGKRLIAFSSRPQPSAVKTIKRQAACSRLIPASAASISHALVAKP